MEEMIRAKKTAMTRQCKDKRFLVTVTATIVQSFFYVNFLVTRYLLAFAPFTTGHFLLTFNLLIRPRIIPLTFTAK